jgi:FKBP-type peptidyl-prolyl cis-trans isomerase 2
MTVKKDKVVEMHYTLKNETGDVLDSSLFFLIKRKKYEIARISHFIQNSKNNNTINSV